MVTKLLIADDHPIVLDGIEAVLRGQEFEIVARCANGQEVMAALEGSETPEILILDVRMPGPNGLEILRSLQSRKQLPKVILLSASVDDAEAVEAIGLGVSGLILKETAPSQLLDAVYQVRRGGRWIDPEVLRRVLEYKPDVHGGGRAADRSLTPRELDIVRLVARGLRNKDIARQASVTEGTVKMHLHNIYEKLGIQTRTELAIYARTRDLV